MSDKETRPRVHQTLASYHGTSRCVLVVRQRFWELRQSPRAFSDLGSRVARERRALAREH